MLVWKIPVKFVSYLLPLVVITASILSPSLPTRADNPELQTQAGSLWPTFRHDSRNTGFSPVAGKYSGDKPWMFQTGKGIFNTPVIDNRGIIYIGSADHYFYALNPDGALAWKYETGEIIDSAAALGRFDPVLGCSPITFISGDGKMYNFRTDNVTLEQRPIWIYQAELRPGISYNRWFEGNVAIGPDGTLYSGNTNFLYYAINPDGTLKWTYETAANDWSQAAFGADGSIFWGSLDTYIRGVSPQGKELWKDRTLGFVAASAAVGSDGTVYIGSFDSNIYALDPKNGNIKWKFPTGDHIYSSAALDQDAAGNTTAILFGSADGTFYAVKPDGSLLWKYDSGDPIRSSPAIGLTPEGTGSIVYFGCGNGRLYALNTADGSLRWAFDTTSIEPELHDRNDLNGSPALSATGIYIGGEHGQLWYVPYDYCLNANDARCAAPATLPEDITGLYYVTPGGNTEPHFTDTLPTSAMITLRLVVRQAGQTIAARLCDSPIGCPSDALVVNIEPPVAIDVQHSADGRYIFIRPQGFLSPGQVYKLQIKGKYYKDGWRLGNMTLGGSQAGTFESAFQFSASIPAGKLPLATGTDKVTGLELTRLAAPVPSMLPSLNQIGFDYMEWLIGPVAVTPPDSQGQGKFILWAIGARRGTGGQLVPDPSSDFTLPLNGRYQGSDYVMQNQNFPMAITGIKIPFNLFELRGTLGQDGRTILPAAYADTEALSIPTFGPYLVLAGLANNWYQKLLVSGTFVTRPYDGDANRVPPGIKVKEIKLQSASDKAPGRLTCDFVLEPGAAYPIASHRAGLLLVDPSKQEAIYMDYLANLAAQPDTTGNLQSVSLSIPAGTKLPREVQVYVMLDVFPLYSELVEVR